jgi:hypothetical protein
MDHSDTKLKKNSSLIAECRHTRRPVLYAIGAIFMLLFGSGCNSGDTGRTVSEGNIPETVDFNLHVRSILSESCFACHGPDAMTREADLRLDTEEGAFAPLNVTEGSFAIVKGNAASSELYRRIISDDPDYRMPTPESNLPPLTDREAAIIKKWIEQGAEYKQHWSFVLPEKTELPQVENTDWPENPIDYFILEKLEARGWNPSPGAGREKLLRRVSFDLTGLPPTVEELDNFLADDSPDAYENIVDRLLASDAYGERMASEWMDAARYADTHGYEDDSPNDMWPWREWLIHAFNQNMPFDQFTTWQLAGDLLPDATREQILATGFNRLHQQTGEGGIIEEEYRVEYVADRVFTTGTAFLGMTMQCARCHDHKYDPISEVEYYQFFSFFDNNNERGKILRQGAAGPVLLLPDEETEELMHYIEEKIAGREQSLASLQKSEQEGFIQWEQAADLENRIHTSVENNLIAYAALDHVLGDTAVAVAGRETSFARIRGTLHETDGVHGNALEFSYGNFINLGRDVGEFERTDPFSFSFWIQPSEFSDEIPLIVKSGNMNLGYRGYDVRLLDGKISARLVHGWPYDAIQVLTEAPILLHEWTHVAVTYDGSSRANGLQVYLNGNKAAASIEHDNLVKRITQVNQDRRQNLLIAERNAFGEQERISFEGLKLDEIRIYDAQLSEAQVLALSGSSKLSELLAEVPGRRNEGQRNVLYNHYLYQIDSDFNHHLEKLRELRTEIGGIRDTLREVMVMQERLNPRQTYVRERGMYDNPGQEVSPGTPKAILEFSDDFPKNRLGLAQWILSPENPLTSRVIVNRYWMMFFGEGIVDTPDDFGNQGSLPTHPELLDWLAVTFREGGWNIKELHKMMVMSGAYRQDSVTSPEIREMDPQNRWLARGPGHRLTAEMIRDNALLASGLLVSGIGGPSVFPYQPEGLWEETTSGRHLAEYIQDEGESLYRRSLYTFIKRTSPPPGMMTFDAAPRTHPVVARQSTNTPLQALHTMNDPIFVEASRLLAERMIKEAGENLRDQIDFAFRAATARRPTDQETDVLTGLFERQLSFFRESPERAEALLKTGEYPVDHSLDLPETAARTVVANTIFNLHETLMKE